MAKKVKIRYDVGIANDFDESSRWPVSIGDLALVHPEFEFDDLMPKGRKPNYNEWMANMRHADKLLDEYMKATYPDKKYKIYYWWWL
jgi:hypothetical protein